MYVQVHVHLLVGHTKGECLFFGGGGGFPLPPLLASTCTCTCTPDRSTRSLLTVHVQCTCTLHVFGVIGTPLSVVAVNGPR